jgi:hypothetical protein
MGNDPENVRYFIQRRDPSDVRVAVYRMRTHMGIWQAHYWDWRAGKWHEEEDIVRRYRNGFDADVDAVNEAEALRAIDRRAKLESQ